MSAKSIMIMGTMSSAGKSFVTAGLCRIFHQDGYQTVPFKAQNMALNSYVTQDGLEMGRAQVMQAEAAEVEPDVRMNPILLKPTSNCNSQVIVNGEIYGMMDAVTYYQKKKEMIPYIMKAYDSLAKENDIIVLEGAGSPAEINLKNEDIVNMRMAKMSNSPVLLVGDIDRGGVFASLYGTIMLMDEEERHHIQGILINKFRGDISILEPGLKMLEELTKIPVLGVIPYAKIDLDDEDSVAERLLKNKKSQGAKLDFAVIRVPRISNFTDFKVFDRFSAVSVRYVENVCELGEPDVIFLPGTKNTMADLKWMRQNGLEDAIYKQHEKGIMIFGICGGFQLLGEKLFDPDGVEEGGEMRGIGLLETETIFLPQKRRTRVCGEICCKTGILREMQKKQVSGYEIHMGKTIPGKKALPFTVLDSGEANGYMNENGTVYGTYLHGFFDNEYTAQLFVQLLLKRKGMDFGFLKMDSMEEYKAEQYNKLAMLIRENVDMKKIYQILQQWEKNV